MDQASLLALFCARALCGLCTDKGAHIAGKDIRVAITGSLLKEVLVVSLRPEEAPQSSSINLA